LGTTGFCIFVMFCLFLQDFVKFIESVSLAMNRQATIKGPLWDPKNDEGPGLLTKSNGQVSFRQDKDKHISAMANFIWAEGRRYR
jgi:hypothetical protein